MKEKILKKAKEFDNAAEVYLHKDRRGCGQIDNSGKETSSGGQGNRGVSSLLGTERKKEEKSHGTLDEVQAWYGTTQRFNPRPLRRRAHALRKTNKEKKVWGELTETFGGEPLRHNAAFGSQPCRLGHTKSILLSSRLTSLRFRG